MGELITIHSFILLEIFLSSNVVNAFNSNDGLEHMMGGLSTTTTSLLSLGILQRIIAIKLNKWVETVMK